MCFLILDMLTLNKLLRTTGFEPLYLLYRQNFFSDFRGGGGGARKTKMVIFLYWNITNAQVTTQNVGIGKLYNVSFDLFKEMLKLYLLTSINQLHFLLLCKFLCALILFLVTVIVCFRIRFFITRYFVCAPITQSILILCFNCFVQNVSETSWEYIPITPLWLNDFVY